MLIRLAKKHYTLHRMRRPIGPKGKVGMTRGGMHGASSHCASSNMTSATASASSSAAPATIVVPSAAPAVWTWEHAMPNIVSILSLPPAAIVPELREEVPEWAIPANAPPGLTMQEKEFRMLHIQASPTLRTDMSGLTMAVRTTLLPQGLRQRLSEILLIPADRLKPMNNIGECLQEHLVVPHEVEVRDMWEKHAAVCDILDVSNEGYDKRASLSR